VTPLLGTIGPLILPESTEHQVSNRDRRFSVLLRWLLAGAHLAALAIGAAAVIARARSFSSRLDAVELKRLFVVDGLWGLAFLLWLITGLWRLLAATEKPTSYYMASDVFWLKMSLLVVILLLEVWPIMTLTRWRAQVRRAEAVDTTRAPVLARISRIQFVLLIALVFAATAMARGLGINLP
jgi:putative membrane protein